MALAREEVPKASGCTPGQQDRPDPPPGTYPRFPGKEGAAEGGSAEPKLTQSGSSALYMLCVAGGLKSRAGNDVYAYKIPASL